MATCTVHATPLMAGSCDGPRVWAHQMHQKPLQHHAEQSSLLSDTCSSPKQPPSAKQLRRLSSKRSNSLPALVLVDTDDSSSSSSSPEDESIRTINEEQQLQLQWMLSQLTTKELETAARASYEYLQQGTSSSDTVSYYASRMALRYLRSKKGNAPLALQKLKTTLQFRQDVDMDGLRQAFDIDSPNNSNNSNNNNHKTKAQLEHYLSSGKNYVRCHDKQGRSTHMFVPRHTFHQNHEWTLKETYYTMERAIACSRAPDSSVNAIIDFTGCNFFKIAPPFSLAKEFVLTMRQHYAGQIHKIFILDAPASFGFLWKLVQPLLGKATQEKIVFVAAKHKERVFRQYYDAEQATTWMCPETGCQTREWNVHEYLYETPFDQAFDEC